ncbi:MAG: 30S ribosomal protein S12 methylthiotransferase RimO [Firmicutes bacterium]|nr:30S ribosomal protein S12 methylthiotransferase RimO [Bacillota bacterium]
MAENKAKVKKNSSSPTKVGFVSLGCAKNLADTEVMLKLLVDAGYEIVSEDTDADIIIINTCAFLESARKEAIDNILDVAWLKKHRTLHGIIVTGCLPEMVKDEIFRELPEVDAALGVGGIYNIVEAVKSVENKKKYAFFDCKETSQLGGERVLTTEGYAYLKIAEGCDNKCTYCLIPSIRGRHRSRPMEDIVEEARQLAELSVSELDIVAQDTSRYGLDLYGEYKLAELVHKITDGSSVPWVRLLYCYPDKITDELIAEIKNNPRVCRYIDMPIQHVSERVLSRMNRHGGARVVREAISRLRHEIPDIVIRTTVMVGFPGETDEDFEELCEFIKDVKFDRLGAFMFSPEEGTPAAEFPDQIDEQTKQDRYDTVMALQLDISEELNRARVGQTLDVLYEGFDYISGTCYGRSEFDAPDVDGKVYFSCAAKDRPCEGTHIKVKITDTLDYDLVGEYVKGGDDGK